VIVDSSALVAVVFQEPGYESLVDKLARSDASGIGTPTLAETGVVVLARLRRDPQGLLLNLLDQFDITEVPFGEAHWHEAIRAFRHFGRGRRRAGRQVSPAS
jgi:ribonuclease VapC